MKPALRQRPGPLGIIALAWRSFVTPLIRELFGEHVSRAHDDAGTPTLIRLASSSGEFGSAERRAMLQMTDRVRVRLGNKSVRRSLWQVTVVTAGMLVFVGWILVSRGPVLHSLVITSSIATMYTGVWVSLLLPRWFITAGPSLVANDDAIIRAWLAERHCPSCLYDLTQTDPADDGLARCPECAHRWRIGGPTTIPRDGST
ncbi:MAG: hypothetical protein K2X32_08310 [Phycisphaerales bacterium]|nr:hypothetical protein [Phycisphaerales bacterium]